MHHLYFIRSVSGWLADEFYDQRTDVWVFGDLAGYRHFQHGLRRAKERDKITVLDLPADSATMNVVILPAAKGRASKPRLKVIERFVFIDKNPQMELVLYGNETAYDHLCRVIDLAMTSSLGDPIDHFHVDEGPGGPDCFLIPRSVSLNIRGPLFEWSLDKLESHYREMIVERGEYYLPKDYRHCIPQDYPYSEPNSKTNPWLSLKR